MSTLPCRPLRADEVARFTDLSYYAFDGRSPSERTRDFGRRVVPERNCLVSTENDEIVSQVMIYELGTWIDGVTYPTGGLANVATVPEKSRRGHASALLRFTLSWMRNELGQCLSMLYPTMFPLYRGLGWALADDSLSIAGDPASFRPADFLPRDSNGQIERQVASADLVQTLEPLYRAFVRQRSGYLERPRWYWDEMVLRVGREDPCWVALWRDGTGTPGGYLVYRFNRGPEIRLNVYEVVALHPEAYHGLLTFLSSHHLWNRVAISAGRDVPWRSMVANPQLLEVDVRDRRTFMLRVVDLPAALALRPTRTGAIPIHLRVRDDAAPWNDGTWRLEPRDGTWSAERAAHETAEASLDIATLSALFDGFLSVAEAADTGALQTTTAVLPRLEGLFQTRYPPTCRDHF